VENFGYFLASYQVLSKLLPWSFRRGLECYFQPLLASFDRSRKPTPASPASIAANISFFMSFHLSWNSENYNHAGVGCLRLTKKKNNRDFRAEQAQLS